MQQILINVKRDFNAYKSSIIYIMRIARLIANKGALHILAMVIIIEPDYTNRIL